MYLYLVTVKGHDILFSGGCPPLEDSGQGYPAAVLQPRRMGSMCRLYLGRVSTIVLYSSGSESCQIENKINLLFLLVFIL